MTAQAMTVPYDYPALLVTLLGKNSMASELLSTGWRFRVSKGRRGYCYYRTKTITIPKHALRLSRGAGYDEYYLAHEMAHAKAGKAAAHGPAFMACLQSLCPPAYVHYELGYKPRNAKAAGIAERDSRSGVAPG